MILVSFYFTSPGFIIKVFHGGNLPALRFFNLVYNCPFSPTRSSRHSAGVHSGFQTDSSHPCRFVWKTTELWRGLPFALWNWGWLARCTRDVIQCAFSFLDFVLSSRNFDVFVCSFLFLPWLFVISMFLLTILILPWILVIAISVPIILLPLVAQSIYIPKIVKNLVFVVRFSFDLFGLGLIGSGLSLSLNLLISELGH